MMSTDGLDVAAMEPDCVGAVLFLPSVASVVSYARSYHAKVVQLYFSKKKLITPKSWNFNDGISHHITSHRNQCVSMED
eukprot:scaffold2549_cov104-Cylindrotheca_fusiformis.AAC.3